MKPAARSLRSIVTDGVWHRNVALAQLLGLCPLLAVSGTVVNALALGAATTIVLLLSNLLVSLARHVLVAEIRIVFYVLVIAAVVSAVDQIVAAQFFELHGILGLFIPLIVTNCAIIGRAEAFASRNGPLRALVDGLATGMGFTLALVALGTLREALGHGTLLADAELLFGPAAAGWEIDLGGGLLLVALPPGAFLGLALLVAARNALSARTARTQPVVRAVRA